MKYIDLQKKLKDFTVFSLSDIRRVDKNFYRRRLSEWQEKGYISKVVKGFYIFSDLELNENSLFEIANRIYAPSYISFEMALSYYGLIPETIYGVTSATTKKTYKFKSALGEFIYRAVAPKLFFGYEILNYKNNKFFKIASVEKALLDYFYINTYIKNIDDFKSLRFNKEKLLKIVDEKKIMNYLKRFQQKKLTGRIKLFLEFIKNA